MNINVEKKEKNIAVLDITFDAKEAEKAYDISVRKIGSQVNIAGFRKGKAPKRMIEEYVGKDYIKREALESLLPKAFENAIVANKLEVISEPQINSYEFDLGKDAKVVAQFELRPEVVLGEYKNLTVEVEEYKNKEDALEKELDNLVKRYTTFEKSENTQANENSSVVIDFKGFIDSEPIEHGEGKNYQLDLSNSNFIPGFAEAIVGHNLNEEFDISVKFPENYHDEKIKGKDAIFKIKINEIKEKKVPSLDDEFAKKVGNFETLEVLKEDIKKYLDNVEKTENEKRKAIKIFETVADASEVELSENMIKREIENIINEYSQQLQGYGGKIDYQKIISENPEMKTNLENDAKKRLKNAFVIGKIAELEGLNITPNDLTAKIENIAQAYQADTNEILKEIRKNNAIINGIGQQVLNEKVTKFLQENNNFVFKESKNNN